MPNFRAGDETDKLSKDFKKKLDFGINYTNTLPDLPFDMKFYKIETDMKRFTEYQPNTLEQNHKYEDHTDIRDLMFLVETMCYRKEDSLNAKPTPMHEADKKLLESNVNLKIDPQRSVRHNIKVPWMRRTEYVSSRNPMMPSGRTETSGIKLRSLARPLTHAEQIELIDKTFEHAKKPVTVHPTKPNVKPISEKYLCADMENWKYSGFLTKFDSNPLAAAADSSLGSQDDPEIQLEKLKYALLRGVKASGQSSDMVTYLLPTTGTLHELLEDQAAGTLTQSNKLYEFQTLCNYSYKIKPKDTETERKHYIICERENSMTYVELETVVNLIKCHKKIGTEEQFNSQVMVTFREPSPALLDDQKSREAMLKPLAFEDEI